MPFSLALLILAPFIIGSLCLAFGRSRSALAILVFCVSAVVAVASIGLAISDDFPLNLNAASSWETLVTVFDFILLGYFLYAGINDYRKNGRQSRNLMVIGLVSAQILLALYLQSQTADSAAPVFFIDHLSVLMSLIISIIGGLICVYSLRYMADHENHKNLSRTRQNTFFFFMVILLGAMNGIVFADNMRWLYFFWEITTLCCYALIRHEETPEAVKNAFRALWMNLIGGLGLIVGIIYANGQLESVSLQSLINNGATVLMFPMACLFLASFVKAAQVPFHTWLLGAMVAPVPVSALLHSSTMVKAGVFLILRMAPGFEGTALSSAAVILGGFTFTAAAAMALSQSESKRVLALSTISNLGLIIMCAGINTPIAITAALAITVFHAVSKALLFLGVGIIDHGIGSRNIEDMQGLVYRRPMISFIVIAAIVTMVFAPFGMVIGKWAALESAGATSGLLLPITVLLLVTGSSFTIVFWAKWLGRMFTQAPGQTVPTREHFSALYHLPVVILLIAALTLSLLFSRLFSGFISPILSTAFPSSFTTSSSNFQTGIGVFAIWSIFLLLALIGLILMRTRKVKTDTISAYMCGENCASSTTSFNAVADSETELKLGSSYFLNVFSEGFEGNLQKLGLGILILSLAVVLVL
ncbi:NADH-quinone oxidoreductase subunit L [Dehalogenimonas etheniformans]|uniref:Oxidoreductase n=1 Tax=Dehalogenimonas etheniformans TaxID=1536648 RepID=A0A2P5P5R6_9CHLR|nr:proton-conducting transporter membrane subunit [Dehalogenimonas etheniformans]PPD57634.1 oxidoreductase [Dehalogenimonas etheniformans]QNT75975.1 NADH-quinone oxidoreductase subunit L [Dehalogenimonas etheniformans]